MPKEIELIRVQKLPFEIIDGDSFEIVQSNPNYLTHSFFKYPCKFIPEIPGWAIKKYINKEKHSVVYDPFCGSGTTLLEANLNNVDGRASEIDPFAKLLTKVKTKKLNKEQIDLIPNFFEFLISVISDEHAEAFTPNMKNLSHRFSNKTINELGRLVFAINRISDIDVRDFFQVCVASIIKKVSFCDDISPKPYVSNRIKKIPSNVLDAFTDIYYSYFYKISELSKVKVFGKTKFTKGNALGCLSNFKCDLAFTSPPYINAFDYGRTLRLENLWLGFETEEDIRKLKKDYIGTEIVKDSYFESLYDICLLSENLKKIVDTLEKIDKKRAVVVLKFFTDMKSNLLDVYNHLHKKGIYGIVIGDSAIRNITIPSANILCDIATKIGFSREFMFSYIIKNPYIRIPRSNNGGLIKYDNVLVLRRD